MYGGRIPRLNWTFSIGVTLGKKDMYNLKNRLNTGTRLLRHYGEVTDVTRPLKRGITGAVSPVNLQVVAWVETYLRVYTKGKIERTQSL